jgi:hypothetical protein
LPEAPPTESSASTSGTPAANMVDSVRVQRAITDLLIRSPKTGTSAAGGPWPSASSRIASRTRRRSRSRRRAGRRSPTSTDEELDIAITNSVGAGSSPPKDLNTSLNAGITKIMITVTTTKATTITAIGYISADLILLLMARSFPGRSPGGRAGLPGCRRLAGFDQVAVQRVEVQRVLAERRRQAGAGLDVGRMSLSSLVMRGLVLPRATMSKDCSSGTPAFIMVASWRVKMAMSFCLIERPPLVRRFLTLVIRMPWRRRLALTTASPPARISPRTTLPFLSLPSHSKIASFGSCESAAVPWAPCRCRAVRVVDGAPGRCGRLLVGDR